MVNQASELNTDFTNVNDAIPGVPVTGHVQRLDRYNIVYVQHYI